MTLCTLAIQFILTRINIYEPPGTAGVSLRPRSVRQAAHMCTLSSQCPGRSSVQSSTNKTLSRSFKTHHLPAHMADLPTHQPNPATTPTLTSLKSAGALYSQDGLTVQQRHRDWLHRRRFFGMIRALEKRHSRRKRRNMLLNVALTLGISISISCIYISIISI